MKTEFLKELGLEQDAIDKIMAENGNDINKIKVERDDYKTRLETAQSTLKSFEGVNVEDLKGQVAKLTTDLAQKDTDWQAKLADIEFTAALEKSVVGAKAKNAKAAIALMDINALKSSKNQQADIAAAVEAIKKDNPYLFDIGTTRAVASTPGATQTDDTKTKANEALRGLFAKGE